MILKFIFSRLSLESQVNYLRKKGIMLGSRVKDGRKIYIYMLRDLFVEVTFKQDSVENDAEGLTILRGLEYLNTYLEKEFKASF